MFEVGRKYRTTGYLVGTGDVSIPAGTDIEIRSVTKDRVLIEYEKAGSAQQKRSANVFVEMLKVILGSD